MISIRNVSKRFGGLRALNSLTLEIGAGEVFGFIGPNGAGKSTCMKILAGLLRPDSGDALVCGMDTTARAAEVRMVLGYMPDFLGVYEDLTVDEYLQFFAAAYNIPRRNGRRRKVVDSVLDLTDLSGKRHALVDALSRGMQQRLGVARVLIHEPKVLLLDEPASGLDPRARIELRELLLELRRMGKTIMVSSHILTELGEMSTSIGIIERGTLLFAGSIADAFAKCGAGERIALTLEPLEAAPAAPLAEAAERLGRDARVARATVEEGQLLLELTPGTHPHHFIFEAVTQSGGRIATFSPRPIKLEDAFLRLTKGALN
jgi:ABC-2 type transport system ATP-binding protein